MALNADGAAQPGARTLQRGIFASVPAIEPRLETFQETVPRAISVVLQLVGHMLPD
jgi:hypothetical protein